MRRSFIEKVGPWLAFGLLLLFTWRLISVGVHESQEFAMLFPLNWFRTGFLAPFTAWLSAFYEGFGLSSLIQRMGIAGWLEGNDVFWFWWEIAVTVGVWSFAYFCARGMVYSVTSVEGAPSLWLTFILCMIIALGFLFFAVRPAIDQMHIWWEKWPGRTYEHPE